MKKFTSLVTLTFLFILLLVPLKGQTLFEENFDYTTGDSLPGHGWTQIRNGEKIKVVDEGLFFPGYLDDIGNAARLVSTANQEVRQTFPVVSSDSLYISYLINVKDDTSSWAIYLYIGPPDVGIFQRNISAYISKNEEDKIAFGVLKNGGISTTSFDYELNTTYLILLKYTFNPGEEDDVVSLWVNPPLNGLETQPDASSSNGSDADSLGGIVLSQITASNFPPDALIDGVRITKTWADLPLSIEISNRMPLEAFSLAQNYPNPFNPSTLISYQLAITNFVELSIFNSLGQKVTTLVNAKQPAGTYNVEWNASGFASGIYYYRLHTNDGFVQTKKLVLLK